MTENITTKLQKLYSPPRNLRAGNKLPMLFEKTSLHRWFITHAKNDDWKVCNWMQNCIFRYLWYCIFIFLRSNYNLLQQVRWFVTWWVESIIISSDRSFTQNIIRETIKVGEKERWIKTEFQIPDLILYLKYDLYF